MSIYEHERTDIFYDKSKKYCELGHDYKKVLLKYRKGSSKAYICWSKIRIFARIIGRFLRIKREIENYGSRRPKDLPHESLDVKPYMFGKKLIFHPKSTFKLMWNFLLMLLLFYTATVLPYRICFDFLQSEKWSVLDICVDSFFFTDILVSFNTGLLSVQEKVSYNRKKIAAKYIKSWFFIDLVSCVPLDYILSKQSDRAIYNRFLRILRVSRIYKIVKILRLLKLLRFTRSQFLDTFLTTNKFNSNLTRIIGFIICIALFIHISGCIWFYVSNLDDTQRFTWTDKLRISDKEDFEVYLTCVYFVFTTFTTVGYGDITPVTNSEKIFTIAMMGFGAWIYSYLIGAMSSTIKSNDQAKFILKGKKKFLKDFAKAIDLPTELTLKVKNYLNMSSYKYQAENIHFWNIFKDLPANLRDAIKTHNNQTLSKSMKFFNDKPTSFINSIFDSMQLYYFNYEENLFEEDDLADEVYFIRSGRVLIKAHDDIIIGVYPQGYYFGEIEIFDELCRICTASVFSNYAEIYTINKQNYLNILQSYEPILEEVKKVAALRRQKYEKCILEALEERIQKYNSLSTEFFVDSEEVIDCGEAGEDDLTSGLVRNDTGVMISFQNDTPFKQKNRMIWLNAMGKRNNIRKDTRLKSLIEKKLRFSSSFVPANKDQDRFKTKKKMIMMKRVSKDDLIFDKSFENAEGLLCEIGIEQEKGEGRELIINPSRDNPLIGLKKREFHFEDHVRFM